MYWFLVEQSSVNPKNILNVYVYKASFCYFYQDDIYFLHEYFHKFSLEGLNKWKTTNLKSKE